MAKRNTKKVPIEITRRKLNDSLADLLGRPDDAAVIEEVAGHPNLLATAAQVHEFMLAGNATFTLKSVATGTRFTYRIRASKDAAVYFVALLSGNDNESSYSYFGYIRRGVFFHGGAKAKVERDAPSVRAFAWAFQQVTQGKYSPTVLECWHEGRCGRCGRKLTVPSSIASGIGPECATRMECL